MAFIILGAPPYGRAGAETSTAGIAIDRAFDVAIDIALAQQRGHLSGKAARRKLSVELFAH